MAAAKTPAETAPAVQITPSGREGWKLYEREIAAYLRELPRLLAEGHAGQHALLKDDDVVSIWDTQADALQAGRQRFGLEPIFVKVVNVRDPERFALAKAQMDAQCPR